jgi:hypothetical protein
MRKGKKAEDAKAVLFKRLYGVKPGTFEKMEDKLCITLKYLREYRTMESIGADLA